MSDRSQDKVREVKGRAKESIGRETGDPELRREGQAERQRAGLKQAFRKFKDSFRSSGRPRS